MPQPAPPLLAPVAGRPAADREPRARPGAAPVLIALAVSDLRARYGRGAIRGLKWLMDPFAAMGVYLVLVTFVLDRPGRAPGLVIACAIVPFQLVLTTIVNALSAVQSRGSIIANMPFRRSLIPVASAITEAIAFASSLTLIAIMMAIYSVAPTLAALWLPLLLAVTFALAVALAYPAALIGLWVPDLKPFAVSAVRATFFLAPGVVALAQVPGGARGVLAINPLTGLFEAFRDVLVSGRSPAAWELLYPLLWAVVLLVAFVPLFRREQAHFTKLLE